MKYIQNEFYCTHCGKKGIPIPRRGGYQREPMHKKKLYCIYCKDEYNHVECRNDEEVLKFQENFRNGVYINE